MARITLGIGTSHTPMLNAPVEDWPRFIDRDRVRAHLHKDGRAATYEELLAAAGESIAPELRPEVLARKHASAMAAVQALGDALRGARLDALVVVGDDQKELFDTDNLPAVLVYCGPTMRNVPLGAHAPGPDWARAASSRYYEREHPREYPVAQALARHMVDQLMEKDFEVSIAERMREGMGEGHAFGFVRHRLLEGDPLPVVPVFLNTYYPPNQPTPRRCSLLGGEIRRAIESFPGDARVGILASGGLSHFTVDEELDGEVVRALRERDTQALWALPRARLNAGNSEIRNWICMAGATEHLQLRWLEYLPAYRTPAGTGTGLCFALWS